MARGVGADFCAMDGSAHVIATATGISQAQRLNFRDGIRGFKIGPVPDAFYTSLSNANEFTDTS